MARWGRTAERTARAEGWDEHVNVRHDPKKKTWMKKRKKSATFEQTDEREMSRTDGEHKLDWLQACGGRSRKVARKLAADRPTGRPTQALNGRSQPLVNPPTESHQSQERVNDTIKRKKTASEPERERENERKQEISRDERHGTAKRTWWS